MRSCHGTLREIRWGDPRQLEVWVICQCQNRLVHMKLSNFGIASYEHPRKLVLQSAWRATFSALLENVPQVPVELPRKPKLKIRNVPSVNSGGPGLCFKPHIDDVMSNEANVRAVPVVIRVSNIPNFNSTQQPTTECWITLENHWNYGNRGWNDVTSEYATICALPRLTCASRFSGGCNDVGMTSPKT